MKLTGNTVLVTGGGSGIGRGIAEALHARGNKVIVAGRRRSALEAVTTANPGIESIELDVSDRRNIERVSKQVVALHPNLNVLFNNAGIMILDDASGPLDDAVAVREVETNFLGAIRLTSALVGHLKTRPDATILYNSSVLAFTPMAMFATYSATKAALHSYAMSQRFMLRDTTVRVQEIAPPWVGTDLLGQPDHPGAMPLGKFIEATMAALGADDEEILVPEARAFRNNAGPGEHLFVRQFNTQAVENLGA